MDYKICTCRGHLCMEKNKCSLCEFSPYTVGYTANIAMNCRCGNILKIKFSPMIYLGIQNKSHVIIIPFPGCIVCGLQQNLPWTVVLECLDDGERAQRFREVYHNYGARN